MKLYLGFGLAAAGLAASAFGQAAPATQPSLEQLQATNAALQHKLETLETRLDTLETKSAENQADISAAAAAVVKDADSHSQLLSDSGALLASGYAPSVGFVVQSEDGKFTMHPGVVLDFRYMANYRQDVPKGGAGEVGSSGYNTENGFAIPRMRFTVDGNYTEQLTYFIQASADSGVPLTLLDAYATYRLGNSDSPWAVKAGQFKDPLWHERNVSEAKQMAADRSLLEYLLAGGQGSRVQGVGLLYNQDRFRGQLVFHDGFNSQNSKFFDTGGDGAGNGGAAGVTPTNFGTSTRLEYMLIGRKTDGFDPYKEYDQFTALGDKADIMVVGGGADFSQAGGNDLLMHTVDAQYDLVSGWGFYAAYLGSYRGINTNQGVKPGYYYDPGFLAQASYLVTSNVEPFARYDYTKLDGNSVTGLSGTVAQEITVGVNYYLYKQNLKLTLDGSWLPNGSPVDADGLGILKDSNHNEFTIRAQMQLAL